MNTPEHINESIAAYKKQLENGKLRDTYEFLLKFMMSAKSHFEKEYGDTYSAGNISPGYMDFTYFPFFNNAMRKNLLRFGIVLNHRQMQFELWLMGQNASIQARYWNLLKNSKWNKHRPDMPKYSVLETTLVQNPNFEDSDKLTKDILSAAVASAKEIEDYINTL